MTMPIEDRADWATFHAAVKLAKASGVCWDCQQQAGFAAVETSHGKPTTSPVCHRSHRAPQRPHDHPWAAANQAMCEEIRSHGRKRP